MNIALADLLITSVLIPASIIVLLAGTGGNDSLPVCKFQWFLATCAFLVTVLSLTVSIFEKKNFFNWNDIRYN